MCWEYILVSMCELNYMIIAQVIETSRNSTSKHQETWVLEKSIQQQDLSYEYLNSQ